MEEELKRKILLAGYYEDNGRYVVEIDHKKLEEALRQIYNANDIIII